jgi:hypothetical protein
MVSGKVDFQRFMSTLSPPAANGLRILFDKAVAAGGQLVDDCLNFPPSVGTGFIKLVPIEPGCMVSIHRYCLEEAMVIERLAEESRPERLLFSFQSFDPVLSAAGHLSTAQLASTTLTFTTVLSVRAQVSVSTHLTFSTGAFVPNEPLTASADLMLAQLFSWAKGMRSVREDKASAVV